MFHAYWKMFTTIALVKTAIMLVKAAGVIAAVCAAAYVAYFIFSMFH